MAKKKFPMLFWIGNIIEVLERFAYYGLYLGFGIYATTSIAKNGLGWTKAELGVVQTIFLFLSYIIPLLSGILADRYGFKKMLLFSYLLYLPGFLLLILTKEYFLVLLIMILIAVAAGFFKPLIAGTVRLTTDETNRTLGFGIFYLMVNVGAFFGPMTAGALRIKSWNYAFLASAISVILMIVITILWYKDPITIDKSKRIPLTQTFKEIMPFLKDPKILLFILLFGIFIEIPFWSFFNLVTMYIDQYVRTDLLYNSFINFFNSIGLESFGKSFIGLFSSVNAEGQHHIAGETLGHTALYIILFQLFVTKSTEKIRSIPTIAIGIGVMILGCIGIANATGNYPGLIFLGIILFAIGEMSCMPRFEQYLISMLPPEKTGLGGGLLRIPVAIGAFSGVTITSIYGIFEKNNHPQYIWYVIGLILLIGFILLLLYDKYYKTKG